MVLGSIWKSATSVCMHYTCCFIKSSCRSRLKPLFMIILEISILLIFNFSFLRPTKIIVFCPISNLSIRYHYMQDCETMRSLERLFVSSFRKPSFIASFMCSWDRSYNESHFWKTLVSIKCTRSDIFFTHIEGEKILSLKKHYFYEK